jgi:two-component system, NarL family, invasion response regulator UvrY
MTRILLVDDHELVRTGIRRLLEDNIGITVVDEAASGEEAVAMVRANPPDLVLMDINMPGIGGLEATRKIGQIAPELPVIVLTVHTDDPFPSSLLKAGASGYLHKGCRVEEIDQAIRQVMQGKRFISPVVAQNLVLTHLPGEQESPFEALSQREMQVMLMLLKGLRAQDISNQLCLSPKTISTYRHRLFEKLNVRTDTELTRLALRYGMLEEA